MPTSSRTRSPRSKRAAKNAARRKSLPANEAVERLINAASELFYEEGVRAIGIDALIERAGVNKMSLYRQFASKDDVIVAYLKRKDASYWDNFEKSLAKHPGNSAKQIVQLCTDLVQRASASGYRGCPFVNVACEVADESHPARLVAAHNKARLLERLIELAQNAGARDPGTLGNSIALIMEGAYTATQTLGAKSAAVRALPAVAATLIEAAVR